MSITITIMLAIVVAIIAWLIIPGKPKQSQSQSAPPAFAPLAMLRGDYHSGPFQQAIEEKMLVVERELRDRQAAKFRDSVIQEVADLVTTPTTKSAK